MQDKTNVFYSAEKIVTISMLDEQTSVAVTMKSILVYRTQQPTQKPKEIKIQVPDSHFVEAAQIMRKGHYMSFIAAIRVADQPKVYFGYFQVADGRMMNSTQIFRTQKLILNHQIAFLAEVEFITAAFLVNGNINIWQTDQFNQTQVQSISHIQNIRDTSYDIAQAEYNHILDLQFPVQDDTAYCLTCGAFLNKVCLFVGYENVIKVFSAQNSFQYICSLQLQGVPILMAYHPSLHQLVTVNNEYLVNFYELNIKNCSKFIIKDQLLTFPTFQTRFVCTSLIPAMGGYLVGDNYGRVYLFKICRNELQQTNQIMNEQEKPNDQQPQQNDQSIQIQDINDLIQRFPFTSKVQGYSELLAYQINMISTLPNKSLYFIASSIHTLVSAQTTILTLQNENLTQNLGFSDKTFNQFQNSKRFYQTLSNDELREESNIIQQQTSLDVQLGIMKEYFMDIGKDIFNIVQSYLHAVSQMKPKDHLGDVVTEKSLEQLIREREDTETGEDVTEIEQVKKQFLRQQEEIHEILEKKAKSQVDQQDADQTQFGHSRCPWTKLFEKSKSAEDDIKQLIKQFTANITDNAYKEELEMNLTIQAKEMMPYLCSFIRNLRKRYSKGVKELEDVQYKTQPQLTSFQYISEKYQNNSSKQLRTQRNQALANIVEGLQFEIYEAFLKWIGTLEINVGQTKELMQGTAHKYLLSEYQQEQWNISYIQFKELREDIKNKILNLYSRFQSIRERYQEEFKQFQYFTIKDFRHHFSQCNNQKLQIITDQNHYYVAINRIYQSIQPFSEITDQILDFRTKILQQLQQPYTYLVNGILYECFEITHAEEHLMLKLSSKIQNELFNSIEDLIDQNKNFNFKCLQLIEYKEDHTESGSNYYLLFQKPENTVQLTTVIKYLLQKIYQSNFFSQKQLEKYDKLFENLLKQNPIHSLSLITYNLLNFFKFQQQNEKSANVPFVLTNYLINVNTYQCYTVPINLLQKSLLQSIDDRVLEFNLFFSAPECLLNCISKKSICYSVGQFSLVYVALVKLYQMTLKEIQNKLQAQQNNEEYKVDYFVKDLTNSVNQMFNQLNNQFLLTQEVINNNQQILNQTKSKFNPLDNEFNLSVQQCKTYIALIRYSASLCFDLQAIPNAAQANDLLLTYMDSRNVQLANFILQNSMIQPFVQNESQRRLYEIKIFQTGSTFVSQLIEQLGLSASTSKRLQELLNVTLIFSQNARFDATKCLKLSLYKNAGAFMEEIESDYKKYIKQEEYRTVLEKRVFERTFRQRPWRGRYEVEYAKVGKQDKQNNKELINEKLDINQLQTKTFENIEEQEEQDELEWQHEEEVEVQQFQADQQKLQQIVENEQKQEQSKQLNDLEEEIFNDDESVPDQEELEKFDAVEKVVNTKGKVQTAEDVFKQGKVVLKSEEVEIKVKSKDSKNKQQITDEQLEANEALKQESGDNQENETQQQDQYDNYNDQQQYDPMQQYAQTYENVYAGYDQQYNTYQQYDYQQQGQQQDQNQQAIQQTQQQATDQNQQQYDPNNQGGYNPYYANFDYQNYDNTVPQDQGQTNEKADEV